MVLEINSYFMYVRKVISQLSQAMLSKTKIIVKACHFKFLQQSRYVFSQMKIRLELMIIFLGFLDTFTKVRVYFGILKVPVVADQGSL